MFPLHVLIAFPLSNALILKHTCILKHKYFKTTDSQKTPMRYKDEESRKSFPESECGNIKKKEQTISINFN